MARTKFYPAKRSRLITQEPPEDDQEQQEPEQEHLEWLLDNVLDLDILERMPECKLPEFYAKHPWIVNLFLKKLVNYQNWLELASNCPLVFDTPECRKLATTKDGNFIPFCAIYNCNQEPSIQDSILVVGNAQEWMTRTVKKFKDKPLLSKQLRQFLFLYV
jgi:hypothetical protein